MLHVRRCKNSQSPMSKRLPHVIPPAVGVQRCISVVQLTRDSSPTEAIFALLQGKATGISMMFPKTLRIDWGPIVLSEMNAGNFVVIDVELHDKKYSVMKNAGESLRPGTNTTTPYPTQGGGGPSKQRWGRAQFDNPRCELAQQRHNQCGTGAPVCGISKK